jgi:hypothetical protein
MPRDFERALRRDPMPPGTWVFFGNVPEDATAEDVQVLLENGGIEITLDRIRMHNKRGDHRASALISISNEQLVARALGGDPELLGRKLRMTCPHSDKTYGGPQ